jgi:preprotein translocase subunit SecE
MTEQTDNSAGGSVWMDGLWLTAAAVFLVAGLAGFYLLPAQPMAVRTLIMVAGLVLAVGVFALSSQGRNAWQFAAGSRVELRKVVWPTMPETQKLTLMVVVFVALAGVFFWVIDWLLAWGTRHLLGTGA